MSQLHGKGLRITQFNEDGTEGRTIFVPNAEVTINLIPVMPGRPRPEQVGIEPAPESDGEPS